MRARSSRNRARPPTYKEVQARRPGMNSFDAIERSLRLREMHIGAFIRAHGEDAFEVPLPLVNPKQRKHFAIVSREVIAGDYFGRWRVTYFDQRGPIGHGYGGNYARRSDPSDYYGIVRRVVEDGADLAQARFA